MHFALPILIGNLLSTGYSIINTIWVGNLLGRDAVGAIAVSFPIFLGMIALCSGATLATSILIANAYGAEDHVMVRKTVNNSLTIGIVMITTVMIGGLLSCDAMLGLLGTPDEIMLQASGYLKITMVSFISLYLSFLIAAVLRGIGNTVIPLTFVILSTVMNAVLDPLLIMGLGPFPELKLNGAAFASLISTGTATLLGIIYVMRKYTGQPIIPSALGSERKIMGKILKIGLPAFVQQMLVSVGYAFMTVFVNGFGASAIAAFGITTKLDAVVVMPATAMMMAASALTAQNMGAGKSEKTREIFKWGVLLNIPVISVISILCVSFPGIIMHIFVQDPAVIQTGISYLRIVGGGYLLFTVFYISNGIINGAGKTISTMVISFVSLCVIRIPLAALLSKTDLGIRGIWLAIVISFAVTTVNSLLYYTSGKWKN